MAGVQHSSPLFSMEMGVIIRTSNWIAEEEKLEGFHNCGFDCTLYKNCCLTDWITAQNGGGLKPCKSRGNAIMKGELSDKRFSPTKRKTWQCKELKKMKCKEQIQVKTEHDGLQDTKSSGVSFVLRSIFIWSDDSNEHVKKKKLDLIYYLFFIVLAIQHSAFFCNTLFTAEIWRWIDTWAISQVSNVVSFIKWSESKGFFFFFYCSPTTPSVIYTL